MRFVKNKVFGAGLCGVAMSASAVVTVDFEGSIPPLSTTDFGNYSIPDITFSNALGVSAAPAPGFENFTNQPNSGDEAIRILLGTVNLTTVTFGSGFSGDHFSFAYSSNQTLFADVNFASSTGSGSTPFSFGATFLPNTVPAVTDPNSGLSGCGTNLGTSPIFCAWKQSGDVSVLAGSTITSITFKHSPSSDTPPGALLDDFNFYPVGQPVPEPSTYALMVLGLLGIGFAGRRRMS